MTTVSTATPDPAGSVEDGGSRDREREVRALSYFLAIFVLAVVVAALLWGLPALVLAALVLVLAMFVIFIFLSRP